MVKLSLIKYQSYGTALYHLKPLNKVLKKTIKQLVAAVQVTMMKAWTSFLILST